MDVCVRAIACTTMLSGNYVQQILLILHLSVIAVVCEATGATECH
jgi:hypothetical protein